MSTRFINFSLPSQKGQRGRRPQTSYGSLSASQEKNSTGWRRSSPMSSAWQRLPQNCRVAECACTATSERSSYSPTQNGQHNKHGKQKPALPIARLCPNTCTTTATTLIPSVSSSKFSPPRTRQEIAGKRRPQRNWRTWSVRGLHGCSNWYSTNQIHSTNRTVPRRALTPPQQQTARDWSSGEVATNRNSESTVTALPPLLRLDLRSHQFKEKGQHCAGRTAT